MKKYIDAVALCELARSHVDGKVGCNDMMRFPSADVAEVVHGVWDDSYDGITPYCSVCKRSHRMMNRTPDYCPNCGAKMDGEREGAK